MVLDDSYIGKVIFIYLTESSVGDYGVKITVGGIRHYGICSGNNRVIHFTGSISEGAENARVRETSVDVFRTLRETGELKAINICYRTRYEFSKSEILRRARGEIGGDFGGYDLIKNNCEHFTTWCAAGYRSSSQTWHGEKDMVDMAIEQLSDRIFEPLFMVAETIDNTVASFKNFFGIF